MVGGRELNYYMFLLGFGCFSVASYRKYNSTWFKIFFAHLTSKCRGELASGTVRYTLCLTSFPCASHVCPPQCIGFIFRMAFLTIPKQEE